MTDITNKYRDQQIEVILYLPVNTRLIAATNTRSFHKNEPVYRDILILGDEEKTLLITPEGTQCLDCIEESNTIIDANIQAPSPPTPPVPIEPVVTVVTVNTNQN